jgi:hypothetical protein
MNVKIKWTCSIVVRWSVCARFNFKRVKKYTCSVWSLDLSHHPISEVRTLYVSVTAQLSHTWYTSVVCLRLICWQILIINCDKCVRCLSIGTELRYDTGNAHVTYNNEARSRNHCCRGKAISITYSKCVFARAVLFSCGSCAYETSWG